MTFCSNRERQNSVGRPEWVASYLKFRFISLSENAWKTIKENLSAVQTFHWLYLESDSNFLIKFWDSCQSFKRNSLKHLCLKREISVSAYIMFTCYFILCTNYLIWHEVETYTVQKIKFSIKDFFSKRDQIRSFLRIWSYLLKKSLMKNFIFWVVLHREYSLINITHYLFSNFAMSKL